MYRREILPPCPSPIENGIPIQGTWNTAFREVDLLGIHHPFSLPFPRWMRDLRIKEWESFSVQDDSFFLHALLFNFKYYRVTQVFFYDIKGGGKTQVRKIAPFSGPHLPRNLANASVESRSRDFSFRIHNWLDAHSVRLDLNISQTSKRPALTAHLTYDMNRKRSIPMAVNLLFSERRCMYAYKASAAVRGDIVFGGRHVSLNPAKTGGLFCDYKGFFPYRMRSVWCTGLGASGADRLAFSITENQTKETYKNNENALWVNGRLTPLPPVRITIPNGPLSDWVIQDMEGMVDLTFTPQEAAQMEHPWSAVNLIAIKAEYDAPLGYYNGMLVNSEGDKIPVRNFWGLGEKLYLRV